MMGDARTYAVADLHGRFDLLEAALATIADHGASAHRRTVVFLGDYVDRGPHSAAILERLRQGPPAGWGWICLKGNHEAMMIAAQDCRDHLAHWIDSGGEATLRSYKGSKDALERHLLWIEGLPTMHVDAHRVFVHAGVDPAQPLDAQAEDTLLWKRYPRNVTAGHGAYHLVHGHDPDPGGPLRLKGRTALDTLAYVTGRLVVAVFDDHVAGGPVDLLEITRPARATPASCNKPPMGPSPL